MTTLEVPALHQSKQIIQTLIDSGYGKSRIKLILNRAPKRLDITPGELEKMLGHADLLHGAQRLSGVVRDLCGGPHAVAHLANWESRSPSWPASWRISKKKSRRQTARNVSHCSDKRLD